MDFSSSVGGPKPGGNVDKGAVMEQVKAQLAVAHAQELIQVMTLYGR